MQKKTVIERTKELALEAITNIICVFIACGLMMILIFHKIMPFFPVLFLFDFCFIVGYPMFLRFVLKKKWFECTKDNYLNIKYILLPWFVMGLSLLMYYHNETWLALQKIAES
jgi:uncharacterized membrane protein YbaN (DUF454 family)